VYRFQLKRYKRDCQPKRPPSTRSNSDSLVSVFTSTSFKVSSTSVNEYGHEERRVKERDRGVQTSRKTPSEGLNPVGSVVLKGDGWVGVQSTALLAWGFCRNSPAFEPKPTTHWSRACYYRHGHARSAQPIGALKQTPSAHSPMLGLNKSRVDAD